MDDMNIFEQIALVLASIGAINWGLTIFKYNLVLKLLHIQWAINLVYGLIGIAGLYLLVMFIMGKVRK